jgi:hypothetical protein
MVGAFGNRQLHDGPPEAFLFLDVTLGHLPQFYHPPLAPRADGPAGPPALKPGTWTRKQA